MLRREFIVNNLVASAGTILMPRIIHGSVSGIKAEPGDDFVANFINPPASARPWCFYMWMNGHITEAGITADLEAMVRMGIGGGICFNSAVGIPRGPVDYAGDSWMQATAHLMKEAQRLGLQFAIHNSPGYSGAGGPWITADMSMQELVWTETRIEPGTSSPIVLPRPYGKLNYYRDAYVVAYPSLQVEQALMKDLLVEVRANGHIIDKTLIIDVNPETKIRLEPREKEAELILIFSEPFEARAVTLTRKPETPRDRFDGPRDHPPVLRFEYSEDGIAFRLAGIIRAPELREMDTPAIALFPAVRATYYRLVASGPTWISELEIHNGPRLAGWPGKTGYTHGDAGGPMPALTGSEIIKQDTVVDLSHRMNKDGLLDWNPSSGSWTILRIGHTTTGEENAAHPDSGKGLELDKFRKEALDLHFTAFLDQLIIQSQKMAPDAFRGLTIDSWEAGKQNWTQGFGELFYGLTKYEITHWMPALTGRIVDSVDATERFLWDVRRVQADLLASNFYGHFKSKCHERNLELYAEPYGDGNFDSLQSAQHLDIVMSEFWTRYIYGSDVTSKQAASAAHTYARSIVAAEAYTAMPATAKWTDYPYSLKAEGDYFFSLGVNRLTFHTFVHQPYLTGKPGMTMGPFGMHIDRNNTWTEQAYPWTKYLQRTQHLLQQGLTVTDICYFKGDNPESGVPNVYNFLPDGYKADVIGPDALFTRFKIEDGQIVLPDGMTYRICIMAALQNILVKTIERLKELVSDGMILVVSNRPGNALGRTTSNNVLIKTIDEFFGPLDGRVVRQRSYGKGKIIWNDSLKDTLAENGISPDCTWSSAHEDAAIHFTHKTTKEAEYYFVSNHRRREESIVASFRVSGRQPEIFDAESGEHYNVLISQQVDGRTLVPIVLPPASSVFVVFRKSNGNTYSELTLDGNALLKAKPFERTGEISSKLAGDSFSIVLWAKPDTYSHSGRSMLFHAPQGEKMYGAGHACVSMGAGQNGVRVYERMTGASREVLFAEKPLAGWTHIVLVYSDGKPSLFLNAVSVAVGEKSKNNVHAILNTPATEEQFASYFEGNCTRAEFFTKRLIVSEINENYLKGLPPLSLPRYPLFFERDGKPGMTAFINGAYQFAGPAMKKIIQINDCRHFHLSGSWSLHFPIDSGIISPVDLPKLISLHHHADFDVRHFSGTLTYRKSLHLSGYDLLPRKKLFLHLGRVEVVAEVIVNGQHLEEVWKEPFMVDMTGVAKAGENWIEILVTNLWPNRMIGDEYLPTENEYGKDNNIQTMPSWFVNNQPKPGRRKSFSTWHVYNKEAPLFESGLLGPVTVLVGMEKLI